MSAENSDRLKKISGFALGGGALVLIISAAYSFSRPSGTSSDVSNPHAGLAQSQAPGDVDAMIASLALRLQDEPSDLEGWTMLGWSYFQTGRPAEAARAYRRALALSPQDADLWSALGEAQFESEVDRREAPQSFDRALALNPKQIRARYFRALIKSDAGDRTGAVEDLLALLRESPPGAEWAPEIRQAALKMAGESGIDIRGRLPADQPVTAAIPGPTAEQMASAEALPPEEQQQMIAGMVDRLAARLAAGPKDADGWVRLMRARMVLGEGEAAGNALRSGLAAFAGDPAAQNRLRAAAKEFQVPTVD